MKSILSSSVMLTLVATLAGCASAPSVVAPSVPTNLAPPAGQVVYFEALANGVQIYECAAKADAATQFVWTFRAPEAELTDRAGKKIGKHYAGPTWQALDGSTIVGEVKARDAGPSASAIPWLLLGVKSSNGAGVLADAKFIQRVQTVGGNAPADGCSTATAKQMARVPYVATYYFYRAQ